MKTDANTRTGRFSNRFPRFVAWIRGIGFAALGAWALIAPRSFFDATARFEPHNQHFLQDIGAFQMVTVLPHA